MGRTLFLLCTLSASLFQFVVTAAEACTIRSHPVFHFQDFPEQLTLLPNNLPEIRVRRVEFWHSYGHFDQPCGGLAGGRVIIEVTREGIYDLGDLGFYFIVVEGSDLREPYGQRLFQGLPLQPEYRRDDNGSPIPGVAAFLFNWFEGPDPPEPINVTAAVFAVSPYGEVGLPAVFEIQTDPPDWSD